MIRNAECGVRSAESFRTVVAALLVCLAGCGGLPVQNDTAPVMPPVPGSMGMALSSSSLAAVSVSPGVPPEFALTVQLACDPVGDWDLNGDVGVTIYAGNQSGCYAVAQDFGVLDHFTVTNLDARRPWFLAATAYTNWDAGITNCRSFTNASPRAVRTVCTTNYVIESDYSAEVFTYDPARLLPFLTLANGVATLTGYGAATNTYTIWAGDSLASLSNAATLPGTNGLWRYVEPISGQRFFRSDTSPLTPLPDRVPLSASTNAAILTR